MKERFPSIIALGIMITLILMTWFTTRWLETIEEMEAVPRFTHEPDAFAENFLFIRSNPEGYPVTRIKGNRIEHFPDDDSFEIIQPKASQQAPNNPAIFVTSDLGRLFDDNAQLLMQGNARLWRPESAQSSRFEVTSSSFLVLLNENIMKTDAPATIIQGNSRISGTGMRYNNIDRTLHILNQSRVEFNQP